MAPLPMRSMLAFLALPGVVAFLVPLLLARSVIGAGSFRWPALIVVVPGMAMLAWCVREFHVRGKGTLAPWDPPRHLVARGLYAVSRNPMYLGVLVILLGWAIGFSSWVLVVYAAAVAIAFHVRVLVNEEPFLARQHREAWTAYSALVPRWVFRSRKAVVLFWIAAAVALPAAAILAEVYNDTRAMETLPAPGTLVDVGGRRLHLLCIGKGEPIVFFESSGWGTSTSATEARERLATRTTVCSYDRAGAGWSDPGPGVMSAGALARDLAVLQDRARLPPPHVIVASSIGGLTAEMFARQFPERVAGLVLVDAANSVLLADPSVPRGAAPPVLCVAAGLAYLGVIRSLDPFRFRDLPADDARQAAALIYNARAWSALCAMARGLGPSAREFDETAPLPPALPLTVLSASSTEGLMPPGTARFVRATDVSATMHKSHQQLAGASTRGTWHVVPDSSHLIASSQPDAVVNAVHEILDALRGRTAVPRGR